MEGQCRASAPRGGQECRGAAIARAPGDVFSELSLSAGTDAGPLL